LRRDCLGKNVGNGLDRSYKLINTEEFEKTYYKKSSFNGKRLPYTAIDKCSMLNVKISNKKLERSETVPYKNF